MKLVTDTSNTLSSILNAVSTGADSVNQGITKVNDKLKESNDAWVRNAPSRQAVYITSGMEKIHDAQKSHDRMGLDHDLSNLILGNATQKLLENWEMDSDEIKKVIKAKKSSNKP